VRTVGSAGSAADLKTLPGYPLTLAPGDRVTLYEENGVVKYYTRAKPVQAEQVDSEAVARIDADLQSLKVQVRSVDVLHTDVANLKSSDSVAEQRFNDESASLQSQSEEVSRLRRELNDVRQAAANKDAEIARLSADLSIVRSTTDTLIARIPIERLNALELQMSKFTETTPKPTPTPTPTPKPTVPRSPPKGRGKG
jgi:vacuolar-type H+-ATPase subunit I/STV1